MNSKDLALLESWSPCVDGLEWAKSQASLHDVFNNVEPG